jgi:hypothetical protein
MILKFAFVLVSLKNTINATLPDVYKKNKKFKMSLDNEQEYAQIYLTRNFILSCIDQMTTSEPMATATQFGSFLNNTFI